MQFRVFLWQQEGLANFSVIEIGQIDTDAGQFTTLGKGLTQLQSRPGGEGIAVARPVNGDFGDAVVLFEEDFFELTYLFPLSVCHHHIGMLLRVLYCQICLCPLVAH